MYKYAWIKGTVLSELGIIGTCLVVQWLSLHAANAGGLGSIPGQGTRSRMLQLRAHMLQLRAHMPQLKIRHAATKTLHSQINKYF